MWVALAVALLSSLMSEGLPRTTAFGSAFNPATTAVALQPSRAQPRSVVEQSRRDDDPKGGQGAAIAAQFATAQPAAHFLASAAFPKPAATRPIVPPAGLNGNPRGPPPLT